MLDNLSNKILNYLESKSWTIANVYWRTIGKRISQFSLKLK